MNSAKILVVDDETNTRRALAELLRDDGYVVETASDAFKALGKLADFAPDVILTDLKLPGMDGLALLRRARADNDDRIVLIMSAFGGVENAVTAMKEGAASYLAKPIDVDQLGLVLTRELESLRLRRETGLMRARLTRWDSFPAIIGNAPAMQETFKTVAQIAGSRTSVLVSGESGTGKELIAAAIHERSPRAKGPFVKLHCAALAETILESELFGHERGSFTGATGRREGRFFQAHGGTLFLDEIGDISPGVQVKLLRFLQEHEFERVGGNETVRVDVRVISATNRDLRARVAEGRFREDLYYRLNVINVKMPALRDRPSDVPLLAMHFLRKYARENDKTVDAFSDGALARLTAYPWPGNVRELENLVERAVVLCNERVIGPNDLPRHITATAVDDRMDLRGSSLAEIERYAILKTLEAVGGSTVKAARMLGVSVRKIQYKMLAYGGRSKPLAGEAPRTFAVSAL